MSQSLDPRHRAAPTPAEITVVRALAAGKARKELAHDLGIAYATVLRHLYNAQQKLDARSAEHLVYLALKKGLID